MNRAKPAEYNLQISIDSLRNDRVLNIDSTEPFNGISKGEKFYPTGETSHWFDDGKTPKVLYVVDVAHAVSETAEIVFNQVFIALSPKAPDMK